LQTAAARVQSRDVAPHTSPAPRFPSAVGGKAGGSRPLCAFPLLLCLWDSGRCAERIRHALEGLQRALRNIHSEVDRQAKIIVSSCILKETLLLFRSVLAQEQMKE